MDDSSIADNSTQLMRSADTTGATLSTSTSTTSGSSSASSYCDNYFQLSDMLALSERVWCTFLVSMPRLGFLDPSADSEHIAKGSKLELPLWLAKDLCAEGFIEISVPKGFNETYREILEADANCVNLHKLCPNYYKLGQHLANMSLEESEDIGKSLVQTFYQRFHRLANYSLSATNDTINEVMSFYSQLDNEEKGLFDCGRDSVQQMNSWENRSIERVTANDMVTNLRKRKLLVMQESQRQKESQSSSTHN